MDRSENQMITLTNLKEDKYEVYIYMIWNKSKTKYYIGKQISLNKKMLSGICSRASTHFQKSCYANKGTASNSFLTGDIFYISHLHEFKTNKIDEIEKAKYDYVIQLIEKYYICLLNENDYDLLNVKSFENEQLSDDDINNIHSNGQIVFGQLFELLGADDIDNVKCQWTFDPTKKRCKITKNR